MQPTGEGRICGPENAEDAGSPLPLRPARAAANDASRKCKESTYPPEDSGAGRVDMTAEYLP